MNTLHLTPSNSQSSKSQTHLKEVVARVVRRYLHDMGHAQSSNLYDTVLSEIEPALLQEVMVHSRGNQSRAAEILGINRATLRKKLKQYAVSEG